MQFLIIHTYSCPLVVNDFIFASVDVSLTVLLDLNFFQRDRYVLLQRKAVHFRGGGAKWLCTCSCQPIWSKEIMSSSSWSCASFDGIIIIL